MSKTFEFVLNIKVNFKKKIVLWYVDQKGYYGREDICICVCIYFDTVSKGTQYIDVIYCNHFIML